MRRSKIATPPSTPDACPGVEEEIIEMNRVANVVPAVAIKPRGQQCRGESGVGQKRQSISKRVGAFSSWSVMWGKVGMRSHRRLWEEKSRCCCVVEMCGQRLALGNGDINDVKEVDCDGRGRVFVVF
jgi:hypothetical protein